MEGDADCLQCHDDFLGTINLGSEEDPEGGEQTDFHSLAAFFARTNISLLGITESGDRNYAYKLLNEDEESVIDPAVPFNRELVDENEESLNKRLANWVTHPKNRPFSRAIVNRVWAIMCGKPMIEPVDDIPLETFDPHPGTEIAAGSIARNTNVPGIMIGDGFEQTAEQMDSISLIRGVTSKEGDHLRAVYNIKTGFRPDPTLVHPAIRLIEAGVRCVEITLGGWDTHANNHELQAGRIDILDPAIGIVNQGIKTTGAPRIHDCRLRRRVWKNTLFESAWRPRSLATGIQSRDRRRRNSRWASGR